MNAFSAQISTIDLPVPLGQQVTKNCARATKNTPSFPGTTDFVNCQLRED
jgi:hypothetical protein